ncbi:class I SAM-dependent methyltransferase [Thalassobacillus sp. CUG 92003]|uniref:class I SAM-dependent methyltransferase n=1 Tax=Thalassobacillus sp. CUG 92003 TaxID=2736641 RepID=UPI0015E7E3A6|nr:class I SAM-dependent methyltransferase [Thalassobacillus sp. CUG 92003]
MSIDFHDESMKQSYIRRVDDSWKETIREVLENASVQMAADIGCGGGIYAQALVDLGVSHVTCVDFSEAMLTGARAQADGYEGHLSFHKGHAYQTGLPEYRYDLVLIRAVIHHLDDLQACLHEARRILKQEGTLIIQDRTPDDCFQTGSRTHIRGYLFSLFPELKTLERTRRYSSAHVSKHLQQAHFDLIQEQTLWETRRCYESKEALFHDIKSRKGRSILHELHDADIDALMSYIDGQFSSEEQIEEKDRWTLWTANPQDI